MDCPICYDAITAQTGVVTTSCGHSYHFSCISSWFAQQNEVSSCPCCRKEMDAVEDLPPAQEDDDDSYESEEDDDEEDVLQFQREDLDIFLKRRGGMGLTDAIAERVCSEVAEFTRTELHFLCVGNGAAALCDADWEALLQPVQISMLLVNGEWTHTILNPEDVVLSVSGAPEEAVAAATKMQAVWRGFKTRKSLA